MTELSFLLDLLLDDELPKTLKGKVVDRIKQAELSLIRATPAPPLPISAAAIQPMEYIPPVAQSHKAQTALQDRAALIAKAGAEPGRTSPRKF